MFFMFSPQINEFNSKMKFVFILILSVLLETSCQTTVSVRRHGHSDMETMLYYYPFVIEYLKVLNRKLLLETNYSISKEDESLLLLLLRKITDHNMINPQSMRVLEKLRGIFALRREYAVVKTKPRTKYMHWRHGR